MLGLDHGLLGYLVVGLEIVYLQLVVLGDLVLVLLLRAGSGLKQEECLVLVQLDDAADHLVGEGI